MARLISSGWKSGDIRIWTKPLVDIPQGWQLCDGTNGTPDMRDRAVVGAGGAYTQNLAFGYDSRTPSVSIYHHTLSAAQMPNHAHNVNKARTNFTSATAGSWFHDGGRFAMAPAGLGTITYATDPYGVHGAGSTQAHNHGAAAGAVDTRQKSIAVYWIMKL